MLRIHDVGKTLCWENTMLRKHYVTKFLGSENIMFKIDYAEKTLCWENIMLRNHYVEKTIYWENIMFRKCYVEKTLCTKNIMLRKLVLRSVTGKWVTDSSLPSVWLNFRPKVVRKSERQRFGSETVLQFCLLHLAFYTVDILFFGSFLSKICLLGFRCYIWKQTA